MNTQTLRTLTRELATLQRSPPEGVRVRIDERNLADGGVEGIIEGPKDTPFENGFFRVRFDFADVDFPNMPPKCTMLTKIFHPNISKSGEICVDTLKKGWQRNYGIGHVLVTVKCLLIVPNPESALNEEAGKLFMEEYKDYTRMAKLMTSVHATPKHIPAEFVNTSSRTSPSISGPSASTSTSTFPSTSAKTAMVEQAASSSSASSSPVSTSTSTFAGSSRPAQPLQTHAHQPQAGPGPGCIITDASGNVDGGAVKGERLAGGGVKVGGGGQIKVGSAGAGGGAPNKARRGLKRL